MNSGSPDYSLPLRPTLNATQILVLDNSKAKTMVGVHNANPLFYKKQGQTKLIEVHEES
jgi:hypothetical protein